MDNTKKSLVIIINGKAGVGKDTIIDEYSKINTQKKILNYSSIDYFKDIAKEQFKWNEIKDEKGRKLLSSLKSIAIEYNNLPFILTKNTIDEFINTKQNNTKILFIHVRESDEILNIVTYLKEKNINYLSLFIDTDRKITKYNNKSDESVKYSNKLYTNIIKNNDLKTAIKELSNIINNSL